MITLRSIVSELELALGRNMIANRPPVVWEKMIEQIKNKRASEIERSFGRSETILGSWISNLGICKTEIIEQNYDPEYSFLSFGDKVAKIDLPQIINLVNAPFSGDHGINLVSSADGRCIYNFVSPDKFGAIKKNYSTYGNGEGIYTYFADKIIAWPAKDYLNVKVILFDPLDGFIIDSRYRKSGELVIETDYVQALEYQVASGQIEHDGVIYSAGETFTAVTPDFIGGGTVRLKDMKRRVTEDDPYPIDSKSKDIVLKRIIGEDYALELQLPVDNKADGKHQSALNEDLDRIKAD